MSNELFRVLSRNFQILLRGMFKKQNKIHYVHTATTVTSTEAKGIKSNI